MRPYDGGYLMHRVLLFCNHVDSRVVLEDSCLNASDVKKMQWRQTK
jgi:hypothetical protein